MVKIISQSQDELVLKEGSTSGIVVGIALAVGGEMAGWFLHATHPMALWIGLAAVAGGILIVAFSSTITVTANKSSGQMSYQKKRLVGAQNTTYAIAEIFRIETRKQWRMENTPPAGNQGPPAQQPVLVAQSVIVFKDGRELPLDHQKNSSSISGGGVVLMDGQGAETAIAARMANFLNVPFEEIMPPNMGGGINIRF